MLKKLRSLDRPPGPLTGVTEVVVDANSSEPTRLDSRPIQIDTGPAVHARRRRPAMKVDSGPRQPAKTSCIRCAADGDRPQPEHAGRRAAGDDPRRTPRAGRCSGRSIHLPDVNAPDAADDRALVRRRSIPRRGAGAASQPFPLAERPRGRRRRAPTSLPRRQRFHTPFDVDAHTQVVDPPRSKAFEAHARASSAASRSSARVSGPGGSTAAAMRRAATRRPWPRRSRRPHAAPAIERPDAAVGRDGPCGARARGAARSHAPGGRARSRRARARSGAGRQRLTRPQRPTAAAPPPPRRRTSRRPPDRRRDRRRTPAPDTRHPRPRGTRPPSQPPPPDDAAPAATSKPGRLAQAPGRHRGSRRDHAPSD